jgi:aryl-alcohol dehydrogenase-like predicted oxidoreductase
MEYVRLGSTGIKVSPLCLGTMTFGDTTGEAEARLILNHCLELGINFVDCANVYSKGEAERILGKVMTGRRRQIVLTSKVGMPLEDDLNQGCASRLAIMTQVEKSLKRLRTEYLDIYFIHRFDPDTPMQESLEAMDVLVRQGKILHVGVSNWAAWQAAKALGISLAKALPRIVCLQPMYNLLKRQAEVEILPLALAENLGVVTYSPWPGDCSAANTLMRPIKGGASA